MTTRKKWRDVKNGTMNWSYRRDFPMKAQRSHARSTPRSGTQCPNPTFPSPSFRSQPKVHVNNPSAPVCAGEVGHG